MAKIVGRHRYGIVTVKALDHGVGRSSGSGGVPMAATALQINDSFISQVLKLADLNWNVP